MVPTRLFHKQDLPATFGDLEILIAVSASSGQGSADTGTRRYVRVAMPKVRPAIDFIVDTSHGRMPPMSREHTLVRTTKPL